MRRAPAEAAWIDDSDLFRRLLVLSVIEKIPEETLEEDKKRLRDFMESCSRTVPASGRCCSETKIGIGEIPTTTTTSKRGHTGERRHNQEAIIP